MMIDAFKHLGARMPITPEAGRGFRFGGVLHESGLLISPDGIHRWGVVGAPLNEDTLLLFLKGHPASHGDFLLLGTGPGLVFPSSALRSAIERLGLGLEAMDTGAACRTYNVLVAEGRRFAAGLMTP